MAKKRRLADMRMHDYCLAIAQQDVEKKERNEKRRKVKRGGDMSMSDKPKKITFRYRANGGEWQNYYSCLTQPHNQGQITQEWL